MMCVKSFRAALIYLLLGVIFLVFIVNQSFLHSSQRLFGNYLQNSTRVGCTRDSTWIEDTIERNDTPPPMKCQCEKVSLKGGKQTVESLDTLLPWLNITTKEDITKNHPNFPVEFLFNASKEKACSLIPTIFSIEWGNRYWQEVVLEDNKKFIAYSAFYDPNPGGEPCLRVLGVSNEKESLLPWCHVWYSTLQPPTVSKVTYAAHLDWQGKNSDRQMPYLLTCPLPSGDTRVPAAVSLVSWPCNPASNLLKIVGAKEREPSAYVGGQVPNNTHSKNIRWTAAVCGPALYYYSYDWSRRLVEWIELHRAVGFGRVFVYNTGVHPNMEKVLQYYEKEGFVHVTHYSFPPPYTDEPSLHKLWTDVEHHKLFAQENVFYTDCPLRHMHQYRFLAHLDADELSVLKQHYSYTEFIQYLLKHASKMNPGFKLQWSMFYNDLEPQGKAASLPEYLWVLRHTRRPAVDIRHPTPGQYKTLYDMDTARGMFAHGVVWCTTGLCTHGKMKRVPANVGYIGHFKGSCNEICKAANYTKEDLSLLKYSDQVSKAVEKTLRELQLL